MLKATFVLLLYQRDELEQISSELADLLRLLHKGVQAEQDVVFEFNFLRIFNQNKKTRQNAFNFSLAGRDDLLRVTYRPDNIPTLYDDHLVPLEEVLFTYIKLPLLYYYIGRLRLNPSHQAR